nr:protein SOGA1 [Nothobranchius furzeri]
MSKDCDKSAKTALCSQKQARTQQQSLAPKKKKDLPLKAAQSGSAVKESSQWESAGDSKPVGPQEKRADQSVSSSECQKSPGAHRKLSDASLASEDLSKDSGCPSGKLSSDSSSEISDCSSEGNKRDSRSSDNDLSWIDGRAYVSPNSDRSPCVKAAAETRAIQQDAAIGGLGFLKSAGAFMDLIMGETTEDLVREVEDLRSENEYLKDEVEELHCEMLEMRDMFQEEEVYQLQELRLQLEEAKKTCRILQYRLRKAERRSIRVAQTGQVDGELVRSLEHDIKVAKSVSLHLFNELEAVQRKNSQLEWENEVLREKTQELEVAKEVLQSEVEKTRETVLKKKSVRSTPSKAEKRLSQQMEDDSSDLKCQLHFAKEELALMCKKLTKLVLESEATREELAKYRSTYGDVDATQSSEGKQSSTHSREAEVKVHLKLVEEEAMLLSRRIVELEVENRGLRAEMSDLKEKTGGEEDDVLEESLSAKNKDGSLEAGSMMGQCKESEQRKGGAERSLSTREGPLEGKQDASDSQERDDSKKLDRTLKETITKDCESLLSLRDHSCILISAIQLLTAPPRNGHSPPPADVNSRPQGSLHEALELLQVMLSAFIGKMDILLRGEGEHKNSVHKEENTCDHYTPSSLDASTENVKEPETKKEHADHLCSMEVKWKARPGGQKAFVSRDSKMRLSLQILWVLHQWCNAKGTNSEDREGRDNTLPVLLRLLQDLRAELRDDSKAEGSLPEAAEAPLFVGDVFHDEPPYEANRIRSSNENRLRRMFSPRGFQKKNWCYVSQEAALLDREDPVKTWDHQIMPLSFPDLDFEQMLMDRSHTAPEKTTFRIYYSPPSARRVQLAQLKKGPVMERESVGTSSPWCTPPTSFSQICLGSSANLSDDMKEMTASWRQVVLCGPQEKRERLAGCWVDVTCSGTQTHIGPQMVSVGQQTDVTHVSTPVRKIPPRVLSSSLVAARSRHISTSLDGLASRAERPRSSTSSPKLYRRHSSSLCSSTSLNPPSPALNSRGRNTWNQSHQSYPGLTWARQSSPRSFSAQSHDSVSNAKQPSKSTSTNRCGLVTEFLRRMSCRADRATPGSAQKPKGDPKNLERVPARPRVPQLHRNDSVTRIVNQRFMKQKEEASRVQRNEKRSNPNQKVRQSNTVAAEEGNYDCSPSSTLTFCFARPSRSGPRQTSNLGKVHKHRYPPPSSAAANSNCG